MVATWQGPPSTPCSSARTRDSLCPPAPWFPRQAHRPRRRWRLRAQETTSPASSAGSQRTAASARTRTVGWAQGWVSCHARARTRARLRAALVVGWGGWGRQRRGLVLSCSRCGVCGVLLLRPARPGHNVHLAAAAGRPPEHSAAPHRPHTPRLHLVRHRRLQPGHRGRGRCRGRGRTHTDAWPLPAGVAHAAGWHARRRSVVDTAVKQKQSGWVSLISLATPHVLRAHAGPTHRARARVDRHSS